MTVRKREGLRTQGQKLVRNSTDSDRCPTGVSLRLRGQCSVSLEGLHTPSRYVPKRKREHIQEYCGGKRGKRGTDCLRR